MMEHRYFGIEKKLDVLAGSIRRSDMLVADRVRLDGDGWIDVEGPADLVADHTRFVRDDSRIAFEIRERLPCGGVRLRLARNDNHHALGGV